MGDGDGLFVQRVCGVRKVLKKAVCDAADIGECYTGDATRSLQLGRWVEHGQSGAILTH